MSDSIPLRQDFRVDPQFINRTLAAQAYGTDSQFYLGAIADDIVMKSMQREIADLRIAIVRGKLPSVESQLVMIRGAFYFRKQHINGHQMIRFHNKFGVDENVKLSVAGWFDPERLETSSAHTNLSGQVRVTIIGYAKEVQSAECHVEVRPILIGSPYFITGTDSDSQFTPRDSEIRCNEVEEFGLRDVPTLTVGQRELRTLFQMPETDVKVAFATILGISSVPADWGGENSDLVADFTLHGSRARAAFAFKGPGGKPKPWMLHPGGMGKNGDQAIRLFSEYADVMVVQHCSDIASSVRHLMEALATKHKRRFMIIDGSDTVRILSAKRMFS